MPSIYCDSIENILWDKVCTNSLAVALGVDIWLVPISSNLSLIERFDTVLNQDEHARASRYHQEKDKQRFMVSRIALRFLLAGYLNNKPQEIEFVTGPNKKPFVKSAGTENFHYNVSHSGDLILIAVSVSDIGIDIEKMDEDFSYKQILEQNFSRKEIDFIMNGSQQQEKFYLLWTRKEALLKATSKGIDSDLPFIPSLDGEHNVHEKIIGSGKDFCISSFKVSQDYIGSVAYTTGHQKIRFRNIIEFSFYDQLRSSERN